MNILIVKTSAIGDVTHTLPALHALRKHYPDAHVTWLVEEAAADIVIGHPALDRVLISKRKKWINDLKGAKRWAALKEVYGFIKQLRDTQYDLLLDFQGLLKSGLLIGLTRAKRKVGFGKGMDHAEHSYLFLNERVPAVDMNHHAVLRELMLLKAIGIDCDEVVFDFPIQEGLFLEVENLLQRNNVERGKPLVAINPCATWETKLWDNDKFAEVADALLKKGISVVFTGSKADRSEIENIFASMQTKAVNLAGKTSLKILAALYQKADVVISTDTGPMHVAAAVNTPVVALFGPTAPWRTGPYGEQHDVMRMGLDCSPCLKKKCDLGTIACMKDLSVDQVVDASLQVLGNSN